MNTNALFGIATIKAIATMGHPRAAVKKERKKRVCPIEFLVSRKSENRTLCDQWRLRGLASPPQKGKIR